MIKKLNEYIKIMMMFDIKNIYSHIFKVCINFILIMNILMYFTNGLIQPNESLEKLDKNGKYFSIFLL